MRIRNRTKVLKRLRQDRQVRRLKQRQQMFSARFSQEQMEQVGGTL